MILLKMLPKKDLSIYTRKGLLGRVGTEIVWTNRYDCPEGYKFNEDGWVQTLRPHPKITVNFLPHVVHKLGDYQLLLQNLLALRLLNDSPHDVLALALWNRATQAAFGREPDRKLFDDVIQASLDITTIDRLPTFSEDILKLDTIWYSRECKEASRAAIKQVIRENYISAIRDLMPIHRKYKTEEVVEETSLTKYAVNLYWKGQGLDAVNRTIAAIMEAMEELVDSGETPNIIMLSLSCHFSFLVHSTGVNLA